MFPPVTHIPKLKCLSVGGSGGTGGWGGYLIQLSYGNVTTFDMGGRLILAGTLGSG